ncbi:hypothetical protein BU25DRAFT_346728 [Macroventuria anomochaeta]|uniref:Uncharacterized protein n=1 Tax=Macroventuria anomochaeta TaxID=301207 RepID=A0ACB6RTD9_9PLEO|nr:uncharacterized protein BU25DRAFT_346728 [Macroventuria anomochaeta]KAF2625053.1 hypothetical protein BU25DRAFT_346728 [Macroventuria anomochaeta]
MAGFIQNILWNSVEGFVDAAKKTGGAYAGDALIKAGDMIEGGGRSVGGGIERAATGYGSKLSGQTYQPSSASKALPSTARKPAVKRSNSMPANTKPSGSVAGGRSIAGPTSNVPLGAKKTVGGAKKAVGGGASKPVGGLVGGATRSVGGLAGGATKSVGGLAGGATKATGGVVNNATKGVGGIVSGASKPIHHIGSNAQKAVPQGLPKPYNSTTAGSSYTNPYPTAKQAPVKPGMSKPFTPPQENKSEPKPYPGTNTLPGQGGKTPVKRTYKPAPTLGSQVAPGQKMTHIGAF